MLGLYLAGVGAVQFAPAQAEADAQRANFAKTFRFLHRAIAAKSVTSFDRLPWYESQGFAFMAAVHGALRVHRVLVHLPI